MAKNFSLKITMIFICIGIIAITALGIFCIYELKQIQPQDPQTNNILYAILICIGSFVLIASVARINIYKAYDRTGI